MQVPIIFQIMDILPRPLVISLFHRAAEQELASLVAVEAAGAEPSDKKLAKALERAFPLLQYVV